MARWTVVAIRQGFYASGLRQPVGSGERGAGIPFEIDEREFADKWMQRVDQFGRYITKDGALMNEYDIALAREAAAKSVPNVEQMMEQAKAKSLKARKARGRRTRKPVEQVETSATEG